MPVLPMHLRAVKFFGHNKISGVKLTIIGCILKGAGGLAVGSKRGDINNTIDITTSHHLVAAFCGRLFFCDASFCDWRVRTFFDGLACAVTLRSIQPP